MDDDLRHRYVQSLFESSPAAMAAVDADGVFVDANAALSELFGFPLEEIVGVEFATLLYPEEAEGARRWFRRFVRGNEQGYEVYRRFLRGDGRELLLRVRVAGVRDSANGAFAVVAVDDVTAERRLVAQVGRHEERFHSLIEEATDLITIMSADGTVLYESPSVERLMGYPPGPAGADAFERIHPDDVSRCVRAFQRVLGDGAPVRVDVRVRHADGHWVDLDAVARNMLDDPAVGGIVINSRDVSDSQRAERELRVAERSYRTLVEQLAVVTYVAPLDSPQPVTYISPQAEDLLGYPLSEWLENPEIWRLVVHPDDYDRNTSLMAALGADEDRLRMEYRLITRDGETVWVIDDIVQLRDEDGTPIAYQGLLVDVSDRVRLEEQLRHSQRLEAIGRLAGGIAHDFNNLLLAISGYSDIALGRATDNVSLRGDLEQIKVAADRATSLTQQLLAFGRQQVLQAETICVSSAIEEVAKLLRPLIGEHIQLKVELEPTAGCIEGDRTQLEQVLLNLALNARDAMAAEGGTLTIRAKGIDLTEAASRATDLAPGRYTAISVIDTGTGMTDATCGRIFDPFYTTKPKGQGTGLGLATAYGIVKQSGGEIHVESVAGSGTRFDVLLPASDREPTVVSPVVAEPTSARGETILLVEDEEIVRMLVASMLTAQGYRVITEPDAEKAVAVAADRHCDLLLTDVVMPNTGGPALADDVVRVSPTTKVLFMSGYTNHAIEDDLLNRSNFAFLQKPFSSSELAHAVDQLLRRQPDESPAEQRASPREVWAEWSRAA
ncbi:MAG: Blue-light-activated protein [Actinomycetia bacterium]|nr:Blue-light-activated protein [Actinomycetes bacterium]